MERQESEAVPALFFAAKSDMMKMELYVEKNKKDMGIGYG